jgi:hypothetical protein
MKRFKLNSILFVAMAMLLLSSCTAVHKSMREPNSRVEFNKNDFQLSEQVTAQATSTKILGIDFERLFLKKTASVEGGTVELISIANIPVIGNYIGDRTANYALYEMMQKNPGYDVVFYPQYETTVERPIAFGFIYKITTVTATARLGKMK